MRIGGILLPDDKKIKVALTYIFGVGASKALKILKAVNVDPEKRVKEIDRTDENKIREHIESQHRIEGNLRSEISNNIRRLKEIKSYRGSRHIKNLPVRGQRTKTNARTKRGRKVTVGSGRKKGLEKT